MVKTNVIFTSAEVSSNKSRIWLCYETQETRFLCGIDIQKKNKNKMNTGEGVEVVEGRRWEAHGNTNHSVSLAMSAAAASFSVAPLSLVAEPDSMVSVSRASYKGQGLDYSV